MLATYSYDGLGQRTGITRGNGTTTAYEYDNASRLTSLTHHLAGGANDLALGFNYNFANQITSATGQVNGLVEQLDDILRQIASNLRR